MLATIILPSLIPVISAIPGRRPGVALSGHLRALGDGSPPRRDLVGVEHHVSGGSGLVDGRRHRADAVAALRQPPTSARMDARGAGCRRQSVSISRGSPSECRERLSSRRRRCCLALAVRASELADCGAVRRAVADFARCRPLRQPALRRADAARAISEAETRALRQTARRTWRFFETFVTPDDNMLPPDNFQEDPTSRIAHRTSPTNIGLYLLSVVCARDFGWIGAAQTIERLEATLATMARMPRFRGHFYNWYDTRDLSALEPKYVSSVDSGNLAGHLIALANACQRMAAIADRRRVAAWPESPTRSR